LRLLPVGSTVGSMARYVVVAPYTISVDFGPANVVATDGRFQKYVLGQVFEADPSLPDIVALLRRYPPEIMLVPPGSRIPSRGAL
jgi:hypothetical protein